jgi:hypothetical protein
MFLDPATHWVYPVLGRTLIAMDVIPIEVFVVA